MAQKLNKKGDNNLSDLSKRFLHIINEMGYTHYRIAKETKIISNSILTHIKSGRSEPSVKVISALLEKFPNVNANWLLTGKGAMFLDDSDSVSAGRTKPIPGKQSNSSDVKELLEAKDKMIAIGEKITVQNQKIIEYFERQITCEALEKAKQEIDNDIKNVKKD